MIKGLLGNLETDLCSARLSLRGSGQKLTCLRIMKPHAMLPLVLSAPPEYDLNLTVFGRVV